LQVNC